MSRVALIPARGGSVRIPRKCIKDFCGKPIILYSIETALESKLFDQVIVSTDDDEIASISEAAGATIFRRPFDDGNRGTQEVAREVLLSMQDVDEACVIYPTSPLLLVADLKDGLRALELEPHLFSMAVGANPLCDAGSYYWGLAKAFRRGIPLISAFTAMVPLPEERVCDINTLADWATATYLFQALRRAQL